MSDFDNNLIEIIEECQTVLFEIEKVIYTHRYNLSKRHLDIFSVQSISMIYSVWEGFIQKSFQLYVDELNSMNIEFDSFCDPIVIHHMENTFKQLMEYPQKEDKKIDFFVRSKQFHNTSVHSISRLIKTESNVSFDVLNKLLKKFSLEPFSEYWTTAYSHPNTSLKILLTQFLKYRNSVAHGGDISSEDKVSHLVFIRYKKLILDLMYGIRDKMNYGLQSETYLK